MSVLFIKSRAKLNLSLNILGVLENNYHDLDMVICPVSMHDEIVIEKSDKIDFTCSVKSIENKENLVYRAAEEILKLSGFKFGAKIHLNKRIWMQAGLGGGSGNAAAVLLGLNEMYELKMSKNELAEIAVSLGADVPLFLNNGLTRVQGIGERVEYFPYGTELYFVIIQGNEGLSTKDVFRLYDSNPCRKRVDNQQLIEYVQKNDVENISLNMHNCLQSTAIILNDSVSQAIDYLRRYGAVNAMMTGSGSAVYGIFKSKEEAKAAENILRAEFKNCLYAVSESEYITIQKI